MSGINKTRENVEAYFSSQMLESYPDTFIKYENVVGQNPSDEVWCALSIRPSTIEVRGLGHEVPRTTGMVFVQIFGPLGRGARAADDLADVVVGMFSGVRLDETSFRATTPIYLGEVEGWYQVNLNIEFVTN